MPFPSVTYTFTNNTTSDATQVNQNFTDLINGSSDGTKDYSISALTAAGTSNLNGNAVIGLSSSNTLTLNASLLTSILASVTFSYDIGGSTIGFKSLYLGSADSAARTTRIIGATVASSWTLTLPTTAGSSGQFLKNSGSGVTTWASSTPTVQKFTSGSGNYTTPANVLYIRVKMCGSGGAGAGGGSGASNGANGNDTTFGTCTASGGGQGLAAAGSQGGAGGAATLGSGYTGTALTGGPGGGATISGSPITSNTSGGNGGNNPLGGAGMGAPNGQGRAASPNTGGGGAGGGANTTGSIGGAGGGAGGYIDAIFSPTAGQVIAYSVGASVSGAAAGTNGSAGSASGSGYIEVWEYYI